MTSPPTPPSESSGSSSGSSSDEHQRSEQVHHGEHAQHAYRPRNGGNGSRLQEIVSSRTRNIVALVVTTVWALTLVAPLFIKGFVPSPYASFAMLGMAGAIFGSNFMRQGPG